MSKNKKEDEDIVYEPETDETSSLRALSTDKLKKKLKLCKEERKEYLDGWQKARADLVNLRKQDEVEKKQIRKFASEEVIIELTAIVDSFDMAFSNKESWESVPTEWRQGVEYIHSQLMNTLQNHGLKEIVPDNEKFNPKKHEAVEMVEGKDNMIVEVVQKGCELNDKVIRVAKVKDGKSSEII